MLTSLGEHSDLLLYLCIVAIGYIWWKFDKTVERLGSTVTDLNTTILTLKSSIASEYVTKEDCHNNRVECRENRTQIIAHKANEDSKV